MVQEVCDFLRIRPDGIYLDLTVGGAGHARAIAQRLKGGRLLAMDWDPQAANFAGDSLKDLPQARVFHENYIHMRKILDDQKIQKVDGILFDLGLSTDQLESGRGFSFKKDEPLDLRFNPNDGKPAWRVLQRMRAEDLAEALHEGADLKKTRNMAEKIIRMARAPRGRELRSTHDLQEAVGVSSGRFLARLTQALRILTNSELKNLSLGLQEASRSLAVGGRAVALSFHSGEDRLVKRAFKEGKEEGFLRILTPKPLRARREERMKNPRCQSARLRAAEKISDSTTSRFSAGVSYSAGTPAIFFC